MELKIKTVNTMAGSDGSQYGKFTIEPLERGFGTTIGNALRRVLLSSLEGTAVTSCRIEGITHEYTAIPGVLEDVIDVMLNLKGLAVKTDSREPQHLRIDVDKPGAVLASDIQLPAGVKVVNPDWLICTKCSIRSSAAWLNAVVTSIVPFDQISRVNLSKSILSPTRVFSTS